MKLCSSNCTPCCDFCKHAKHHFFNIDEKQVISMCVIGCNLHEDEKHQDIAIGCGYCEDFHCFDAED